MSALWDRLDDALADAFEEIEGLTGVEVAESWNPDAETFPRLILFSTSARLEQTEHGGAGVVRVDATYQYMAVGITTGATYRAARRATQALFVAMVGTLKGSAAILQAAMAADTDSTERAIRIVLDRSNAPGIEVRGRQGPNQGIYRGLAIVPFTVEARI